MIELICGTYGLACWLLFKKFRVIPINTYTIMSAILGGVVLLLSILTMMMFCHPSSADGRLYAPVVQIASQVRGLVTEVPVVPNEPLKAGDVLFRIDSRPFQFEVDRLEAKLSQANVKLAQLNSKLAAAEAATRFAKSNMLVSESETDRQERISLEKSVDLIAQTTARLSFAKSNLERYTELQKRNTVATAEFEQAKRQEESLTAELSQAEAAKRAAEETLRSGSDRMQAAREDVKQAEAQEQEARDRVEGGNRRRQSGSQTGDGGAGSEAVGRSNRRAGAERRTCDSSRPATRPDGGADSVDGADGVPPERTSVACRHVYAKRRRGN